MVKLQYKRKRRKLTKKHKMAIASAVIVAGIGLLIVRLQSVGPRKSTIVVSDQVWYYDLNTKELFPGSPDDVAPIEAPSGQTPEGAPAGMRAYVFACGECEGDNEFIAYLEKFSPIFKKMSSKEGIDRAGIAALEVQSQAMRRVDGGDWELGITEEGQEIINEAIAKCPKGKIKPCFPPPTNK